MKFKAIFISFLLACTPLHAGLSFDAVDDFVTLGSTNIPTQGNVSVFVAALPSATTAALELISRRDGANGTKDAWALDTSASAGKVRFFKVISGGGNRHAVTSSNTFSANQPIYVAASMDSNNTACIISLNGTSTSGCTLFFSGVNFTTNISPMLGAEFNGASKDGYFNGSIFQACVWNTNLTSAQLDQLTTARTKDICKQISPANLQLDMYLDDYSDGTSADLKTFKDQTNNANNGTADNGANNTGMTMNAEKMSSYA